jgi:hypothetical protein
VRITGITFGVDGLKMALGAVVRKP